MAQARKLRMNFELESVDGRRTLRQILTADIKQINHIFATSRSTLGNHYHKNTTEYFYVISGEGTLEYGECYENMLFLQKGSMAKIEPMTPHRITCWYNIEFMTFLTKEHSKDFPDIWTK
jgi:mannose-6-phosphate isomerase-like protein (cupin superfamily)